MRCDGLLGNCQIESKAALLPIAYAVSTVETSISPPDGVYLEESGNQTITIGSFTKQ